MKKNLAKRIILGLLTGAVLMSSSVAWAKEPTLYEGPGGTNSVLITQDGHANQTNSIAIGYQAGVGQFKTVNNNSEPQPDTGVGGVALGASASVIANGGVALGAHAKVNKENSVALGYGSIASEANVVSVGDGGALDGNGPDYRKIVNVADGTATTDAVNLGQLQGVSSSIETKIGTVDYHGDNSVIPNETNTLTGAIAVLSTVAKNNQNDIGSVFFEYTNYLKDEDDLTEAAKKLDELVKVNTDAIASKADKDYVDNNFVRINTSGDQNLIESSITIKENNSENPVTIDSEGITVGTHSARMDGSGFYVWDANATRHIIDQAKAALKDTGEIIGAGGAFKVDANGNVIAANLYTKNDLYTKTETNTLLNAKANAADVYKKTETYSQAEVNTKLDGKADKATTLAGYGIQDAYTKDEVDGLLGNNSANINSLNQRLDRTNAKINKVGAGAAALAALHPLDYDPDDKLTFSAGVGNYAGENAAALGAFYRPNEKFMVSLGGTMGNGENMVNLGISIGLDKANGLAKLSKKELIQKVNAVEAKYEVVEAENEAMKAEMAEMKAMLQELLAKK